MRNYGRSDGLGAGTWMAILAGILILAGAVTLAVYGGKVHPAQHEVEQVLSNDRFPH